MEENNQLVEEDEDIDIRLKNEEYKDFLLKKHKINLANIESGADNRFTKNGFFNLEGYLTLCGIDWTIHTFAVIINAPRDIGKSFGTWEWIEKNIWIPSNYQAKIAYARTNLTKLNKVRSGFNATYHKKYYMSENAIYKIEYDEEGFELNRKNWKLIGTIVGIANAANYKSNWYKDHVGIFWDEYNELAARGLWKDWLNVWLSVKRKMEPFFAILVGNKDDPDNDILVKLEIDLPEKDDGNDKIIKPDVKDTWFIDISIKTFSKLEFNYNSIINSWATKDDSTNRYLNEGGYLTQRAKDIMLYKHILEKKTHKVKMNLVYQDFVFEYGTFDDCIYIHQVEGLNQSIPTLALDNLGYIINSKSKKLIDNDFYLEFAKRLKYKIRKNKLFFTTYDAKDILLKYIVLTTEIFD